MLYWLVKVTDTHQRHTQQVIELVIVVVVVQTFVENFNGLDHTVVIVVLSAALQELGKVAHLYRNWSFGRDVR